MSCVRLVDSQKKFTLPFFGCRKMSFIVITTIKTIIFLLDCGKRSWQGEKEEKQMKEIIPPPVGLRTSKIFLAATFCGGSPCRVKAGEQ